MKHIKLFEQFILESDLDKFYSTVIKNPKTGREVTVKTILGDPDNPMYKKVKAKEDQMKGGSDSGVDTEAIEDQIGELEIEIDVTTDDIKDYQKDLTKVEAAFERGVRQMYRDLKDMGEDPDTARDQYAEMDGEEEAEEIEELKGKIEDAKKRQADVKAEIAELRKKLK